MYELFIILYNIGVWVASFFSKKVRTMWKGEHRTFRVLREKIDPNAMYIWFHAASLGEFEQGRPIMEAIRREHPGYKILLTFFSPSGYEVRKNYDDADVVVYLPIDTKRNASRFLRLTNPVMAFFIKYEFWSNYLHMLKERHVPTFSVSSIFRPNQIFFRAYGKGYGKVLDCFTHFFVQNEESRDLLKSIGIDCVSVTGDTRFDRVLQIRDAGKSLPIVENFVGGTAEERPHVFIAGSSWPPDEDIFIRYFNEHRDWKLIIAPHVIGDDHMKQILGKLERKTVRYTEATTENVVGAECLIIDCFGLLSSIYRYADVTYVGGGFGVGIHNVLEAAVWGKPVIFGPNNKNFQEAQGLLKAGGGFEITSYDDFVGVMRKLADGKALEQSRERAGGFVESLAGATRQIMKEVKFDF